MCSSRHRPFVTIAQDASQARNCCCCCCCKLIDACSAKKEVLFVVLQNVHFRVMFVTHRTAIFYLVTPYLRAFCRRSRENTLDLHLPADVYRSTCRFKLKVSSRLPQLIQNSFPKLLPNECTGMMRKSIELNARTLSNCTTVVFLYT